MPKALHEKLKKKARKKFGSISSERARRFIWGILNKIEKSKKRS